MNRLRQLHQDRQMDPQRARPIVAKERSLHMELLILVVQPTMPMRVLVICLLFFVCSTVVSQLITYQNSRGCRR